MKLAIVNAFSAKSGGMCAETLQNRLCSLYIPHSVFVKTPQLMEMTSDLQRDAKCLSSTNLPHLSASACVIRNSPSSARSRQQGRGCISVRLDATTPTWFIASWVSSATWYPVGTMTSPGCEGTHEGGTHSAMRLKIRSTVAYACVRFVPMDAINGQSSSLL